MSVFICSINELNREAITQTLNDSQLILGSKATGFNHFFSDLVCTQCFSKCKKFFLECNCYEIEDQFEVKSDLNGNFSIYASQKLLNNPVLNQINIINMVLNNLKELKCTSEIHDEILEINGFEIKCICGHNKFNKGSKNE